MLGMSNYRDLGQGRDIACTWKKMQPSPFDKSLSKPLAFLGVSIKGGRTTQIWALPMPLDSHSQPSYSFCYKMTLPNQLSPRQTQNKQSKCVDGISYRSTVGLKESQHWIKVLDFLISTKQIRTKPPWYMPCGFCSYDHQCGADTLLSFTD